MAAEDRFANIFTATVTETAAQALTFTEMNLGITLRDRIALVIDELYFYPTIASLLLMTTSGDLIQMAITISDSVTNIGDLTDRRIIYDELIGRLDFGTAASGTLLRTPIKASFAPPIIVLPTRLFFGIDSVGTATPVSATLRMHYRTVSVTSDRQIIEVLETLQQGN